MRQKRGRNHGRMYHKTSAGGRLVLQNRPRCGRLLHC
ncbi:MAG TPA: 50S ribosomal protein L34 [Anaerolineae bacterium]|nr:50S ribosomal protein L34 [Anaerolineae bacterium]